TPRTPAHSMSTDPNHPVTATPVPVPGERPAVDEIRVYSHSPLFYWWPVWLFGFLFALITVIDADRLAIVPADSLVVKVPVEGNKIRQTIYAPAEDRDPMAKITHEVGAKDRDQLAASNQRFKDAATEPGAKVEEIRPRVSGRSWMGPTYMIILFLV